MKKLFLCKDQLNNKVIECRVIEESENIKYLIVDNPPVIEDREGVIGKYDLDSNGQVVVVYEPKPKTEMDIINEKLDAILGTSAQAVDDGLINMELIMGTDEKVSEIQSVINK